MEQEVKNDKKVRELRLLFIFIHIYFFVVVVFIRVFFSTQSDQIQIIFKQIHLIYR